MPLNQKKVAAIILEECNKLPERCSGYREEILASLSDIIQAERQHRIQATNIQQRVSEKCNALGRFLAVNRGQLGTNGDER